jgi:hypothetical protein
MARNNTFLLGGVAGSAGAGVIAEEFGTKYARTTVLTFSTPLPAIAGDAALAVGVPLYTLPAGACIVDASRLRVEIRGVAAIQADTPDVGLGTTLASGAVAVLGGTAAFENILTGQTLGDCDGTAIDVAVGTDLVIASSGDHTIYLNVADTWAEGGDPSADIAGKVVIHWTYQGD